MAIAVSDQRIIDSELRELGGLPATMLFSGLKQIGIGQGGGNQVAIARRADANEGYSAAFETVFFDVHSGARYLVSKGEIVKALDGGEASGASQNAGEGEVRHHVVAKSFYLGAGGD